MGWRRGQAYSQDLRDRVLAADEESAREAAERFGVSASYVVKVRQQRAREGRWSAGPRSRTTRPKLAEHHAAIDAHVREYPGATLEERRAWLRQEHGISVSIGTMWNTLRRLEVTRKKRPSRQANEPTPTSPEHAVGGSGYAAGLTQGS